MSSRISQEKGNFSPERAQKNMQGYLNNTGMNYIRMAEKCGLDRRVISDLACGKDRAYNADTFEQLAKTTGIIPQFWQGLIDRAVSVNDPEYLEQKRVEAAFTHIEEMQRRKNRQRITGLKGLFKLFGYEYAYVDDEGKATVEPVWGEYSKPHRLTPLSDMSTPVFLDDTAMWRIESRIKDIIDLEIYRQEKEGINNGNS